MDGPLIICSPNQSLSFRIRLFILAKVRIFDFFYTIYMPILQNLWLRLQFFFNVLMTEYFSQKPICHELWSLFRFLPCIIVSSKVNCRGPLDAPADFLALGVKLVRRVATPG